MLINWEPYHAVNPADGDGDGYKCILVNDRNERNSKVDFVQIFGWLNSSLKSLMIYILINTVN